MSVGAPNLTYLSDCLTDRDALDQIKGVLEKVDKCCKAVDRNMNLADILTPKNLESLGRAFGPENFQTGVELILKVALCDYETRSFTVDKAITGAKKFEYLHKCVGGWAQFDFVMAIQNPATGSIALINPRNKEHWANLGTLPERIFITIYIKTSQGKRSRAHERLAAERVQTVFDVVQNQAEDEARIAPVVQLEEHAAKAAQAPPATLKPKAKKSPSSNGSTNGFRKSSFANPFGKSAAGPTHTGPPSFSFKVTVNKADTFVHAGNAQLVINHLKDYAGRVEFFVLRGEKQSVALDADIIWGAEIRNGETVLYEFFGPKPEEDFVKELAKRTNKYTQMDKMTG